MKLRYRYGLIICGIALFAIAVPFIVNYVTGKKVGTNLKPEYTGIFAVRTIPDKVDVLLGGEKVDETPSDLKFLSPGFYDIALSKAGYKPWHKSLQIIAGKVTWVNPEPSLLYLFLEKQIPERISDNAIDMQAIDEVVFVLKQNAIDIYQNGALQKHVAFSGSFSKIKIVPSQRYALVSDSKDIKAVELSTGQIIAQNLSPALLPNIQVTSDDQLTYISSGILYSKTINGKASTIETARSLYVLGYDLYYITGEGKLKHLQINNSSTQVLDSTPPCNTSCELYVSKTKQVFLKNDVHILYRLSNGWEPMGTDITALQFEPAAPSLLYQSGGELYFYDFDLQKSWLVDRSSDVYQNLVFRGDLGYAFHLKGTVQATELDRRSSQNNYEFNVGSGTTKFFIPKNAEHIISLTGSSVLQTPLIKK